MSTPDKVIEIEIGERIKEILDEETMRLKRTQAEEGSIGSGGVVLLEKLTKIFTMVSADHRENLKHGVYGDLKKDELKRLKGEATEEEHTLHL